MNEPCQPVTELFFLFLFSPDTWYILYRFELFWFLYFLGIWVFEKKNTAKKKKNGLAGAWQGLIKHVYKQSGSPKSGVGIWTFVR